MANGNQEQDQEEAVEPDSFFDSPDSVQTEEDEVDTGFFFEDQDGEEEVDTESFFDDSEEVQQEDQDEASQPFDLGDSTVSNIIESAANFFVPKEDPEGSPDAFDFEATGESLERGVQIAIDAFSNVPEFLADNFQKRANEFNQAYMDKLEEGDLTPAQERRFRKAIEGNRTQAQVVQDAAGSTTNAMRNYADTFNPKPSKLHEANDIWDWFEPNRIWNMMGEQAPLTGALAATYLANPYAGAATMYAVEGGEVNSAINEMKKRGVEVDPTVQHIARNGVGMLNMSLEKFGIDKIIGASRKTGFKRKALGILTGALTEAPTEAGQEASQAIGAEIAKEVKQFSDLPDKEVEDLIPENIGERMLKGFYGGLVVGGGMSMGGAVLSGLSNPRPGDAEVVRFERDDQGTLTPIFRVTKPGHEMELQEVGMEEMQNLDDVQTPDFRLDMLVQEGKNAGLIEDDSQGEVMKTLIRARAAKENVSAEEWIYENIESIVRGDKVNKSDLLQEVQNSIDEVGTESDLQVGELPESGDLKPALMDTEGRLYLGVDSNTYDGIAAEFGLDMSRTSRGFANANGNFISRPEGVDYIRNNTDIVSESALKEIREGDETRVTDPNQEVPLSERSLIGREATDDLTRALREASLLDRANNLRSWFENSKITEADGGPQVVYHGTRGDFNTFNLNRAKVRTDNGWFGEGYYFTDSPNMASFFANASYGDAGANVMPVYLKITNPFEITRETSIKDIVDELGLEELTVRRFRENGITEEAVSDQELLNNLDTAESKGEGVIDYITNLVGSKRFREILVTEGYDGVKAFSTDDVTPDATEYVAFVSNQVKSAVGNRGTFNWDNKNILFQREGGVGEAQGAVNFDSGRAVIKAFDSADFTTMLHELSHVFRRSLTESELSEIMETMESDTEKGWTREAEEEFADRFMEWAEGGEVTDSTLREAFRTFRDWLVEIVGNLSDSEQISLSEDQEQFFNNMFGEIQNEANQMQEGSPERMAFLARWHNKLMDIFDVEHRFAKVGMAEVGFHIKNYFSIQEVYTQEAVDLESRIGRMLGGDQSKQVEAVLAAESPQRIEELREQGKDDVADAAEELRRYFDRSQAEYQARGVDGVDFKRRILSELDSRIKRAESDGDVEKATDLRNRFQEIQENFEFVGIPFKHWFQSEVKNDIDNAIQLMEVLATKYKRNTVKISDLLEEGVIDREDVTTRSILESYSTNKAKDIALLNIRKAAIEEGGMIPIEEGQDYQSGYHRPPSGAIVFEGYQVRDVIGDWIRTQLTKNDELGAWKRFFNKVKMAAFWNPFFLPMYDVLQSTMAGATQFMRPVRTAQLYANAFNDVFNRTEEYYAAEREGVSSKPYNSPYEEISRQFDRASRTRVPNHFPNIVKGMEYVKNYAFESLTNVLRDFSNLRGFDWVKTLGGTTIPLRAVYQTSWDSAWYLDRTIRQVTYRHFKQEGFSDREAAQKSAETHADYASVPPNTRRALNSIFFTPTFKIAMGKWFADSLRSVGNVLQGDATLSQKELASVAVRTVGILTAFDMMMLSLGFERDEFGRRYKRPADTDKGLKELVITWTGPHNLFLKYAQRIQNATQDPSVTNVAKRLLQQHSWELHPVYRIANSVINNSTPGGEKIYNSLDDDSTKLAKMTSYAVNSAVALVAQLNEEQAFGEKGAEVFAREYGKMWEVMTKPFIFKYTRQPEQIRITNQVQMLKRIADEEIGASTLARKILSSEKDTKEAIEEFTDGLDERSQNFSERLKGIIQKLEENQYDRTNNPPIDNPNYQDSANQDTVNPDEFFDQ